MNTLVIVVIAAVCLLAGYTLYGWRINGASIRRLRPRLYSKRMVRIMYPPTAGWYLPISFHPSRAQAL